MNSYFCSQQQRVAAAIQAGQWPDACGPELRAHAETCETCGELALVAQSLRQSRNMALQQRQLPAPGLLWWRAQVRRRNAAIERVTRPIAIVEAIALLVVLVAAVSLVAWRYQEVSAWLSTVWGPFAQAPALLMLGAGSLLVFGGFALYLLRAKE